jgi:hypothetical protein
MKLTTTLELLKNHDPCTDGYLKLKKYLRKGFKKDSEINLLTILDSNGVEDCLWSLRATIENCEKMARLIAADCAESVLYIYQDKKTNDERPKLAIQAARDFANGLIDISISSAARAAACAAARDDAWHDSWYAARAAACAAYGGAAGDDARAAACAAGDAAWYAAYAAGGSAWGAAVDAEKSKQAEIIKKYLSWD